MGGLKSIILAAAVAAASFLSYAQTVSDRPVPLLNDPVIDYFDRERTDPIARLQAQIERGERSLQFDPSKLGYLPDLLKALDVNVDSQVLAFAKNSAQPSLISPTTPRAIFFNDTVAIGSVKDSEILELAALDTAQGVNFYTLQNVADAGGPKFERQDSSCLQCHMDEANQYVAGLTVMSVYPAPDGTGLVGAFSFTDHRTPLEERWGGWYVTGTHGSQRHRGNAVARDPFHPADLETVGTMNLKNLSTKFDAADYLAPTSDIVALMTLEHQTRMTNLITLVGWQARAVRARGGADAEAVDKLRAAVEELVTYMVFADEAPLTEPVVGVSTFTKTFAQRGPRDSQGRSLRDFDLRRRLFRYPLSYMIYAEAFDAIPDNAREQILRQLYDVLTGRNTSAKFARLSAADRLAVLEILRETKPNLPEYWKSVR
jgi:hypothetical protein